MSNKKKIFFICLLIISLILIDQITKCIVVNNFVEKVGTFVASINLNINTGMALGLNEGNTKNIIITIIILILIINFAVKQKDKIDRKTAIALCLITAGGISNLIDRFIYKGIVDFIDLYGFPIFNIADVYIVIGWMLLIICVFKYGTKKE